MYILDNENELIDIINSINELFNQLIESNNESKSNFLLKPSYKNNNNNCLDSLICC